MRCVSEVAPTLAGSVVARSLEAEGRASLDQRRDFFFFLLPFRAPDFMVRVFSREKEVTMG